MTEALQYSAAQAHCAHYRQAFGLPTTVDPDSGRILLAVGAQYGAVTMPATLGMLVQQTLKQDGLSGPVLAHARADRWTFLTGPGLRDTLSPAATAKLFRHFTTVAALGTHVTLPAPADELSGRRTWVQAPSTTGAAPPIRDVVAAVGALTR